METTFLPCCSPSFLYVYQILFLCWVIPSCFVAFWWFFSYSFVLYFLLFFQRCPILFTQFLKAQAASYACTEAWEEENRRVYALLHIPSSWVQNQVNSLLSSSSSSEKHPPALRGPGKHIWQPNKSQGRGATFCYLLFGSKLFNNVKGGSTT